MGRREIGKKGRTLALKVVSLAPEVVALVLESLVLVADGVETLGESGKGVLRALWTSACGLEVFVLNNGRRSAGSRGGRRAGCVRCILRRPWGGGDGRDEREARARTSP